MDLSAHGLIPLTIKDKHRIDSILNRVDTMLSAYSFISNYVWSDHFNFHWGMIDGCLCLFAQYGKYVYMPVPPVLTGNMASSCNSIVSDMFDIMDRINNNKTISRIENIDESWVDLIACSGYKIKTGDPEYVYMRKDLSDLKGDAYKSKRAMCNYFEKHYRYGYEPFEPGHAAQCIELFNSWSKVRSEKVTDSFYNALLEDSFSAHKEAVNNYYALELTGRVVIIDNKVEGYIFGFERNKNILYVLFEVANPGIKGLAQFIFREFCKEMDGYAYINALGDSGLENLRDVKLSYKPFCLAKAFTAYRV